jgi:UDP-GlcNAc:undecaprenyl-phosphate GlcNAc-1-phosphate transferase
VTFLKAVALGSVLSILALLLLYRFESFSRAVFVVDALLLILALAGSRMAFRFFRQFLPTGSLGDGRRVLIYGAGDGGELVLRELKNNPDWNYKPVGFVDDDPLKKGKFIHGLKVYGGNGLLKETCLDKKVEEILLSSRNISPAKLREIKSVCQEIDVSLKRALLKVEAVDIE